VNCCFHSKRSALAEQTHLKLRQIGRTQGFQTPWVRPICPFAGVLRLILYTKSDCFIVENIGIKRIEKEKAKWIKDLNRLRTLFQSLTISLNRRDFHWASISGLGKLQNLSECVLEQETIIRCEA
jgi:hypothetical protein